MGRLGVECLAAIGIAGLLWVCIQLAFTFLGAIGTIEAAKAAASGDLEKVVFLPPAVK